MPQEEKISVSCRLAEEEAIRREMAELHLRIKPLREELRLLEDAFIKLWRKKEQLERQRIPVVKISSRGASAGRKPVMTAESFLSKLEQLPAAQQAEVLKSLLRARKETA